MKRYFRLFLRMIGLLIALPFSILFIIFGFIADYLDRYSEVSAFISRFPFYVGEYIRLYYYKFTLKKVGKRVTFKYGSYCQYRNCYIGDRVLIGFYNLVGEVNIGNDVLIGSYVNFASGVHQHSYDDSNKKINDQKSVGREMINVGCDVWIGNNCSIANDIGDRCVIGTGSIVVSKLDSHGVYAGNPAKFIKRI